MNNSDVATAVELGLNQLKIISAELEFLRSIKLKQYKDRLIVELMYKINREFLPPWVSIIDELQKEQDTGEDL